MPVEIKELHIKATVLAEGDALRFHAPDTAGQGTHTGGLNVAFGDGSVRAVDDGPAVDAEPVPTDQPSFNFEKIEIPSLDGADLFA